MIIATGFMVPSNNISDIITNPAASNCLTAVIIAIAVPFISGNIESAFIPNVPAIIAPPAAINPIPKHIMFTLEGFF